MDHIKAAADLVLRYLITRALFRGAVFKPPPNLEHQIRAGVRYLAKGVLLNEVTMGRTPAIVDDRKDRDFWAAVIGGDDGAIDMDKAQLDELRRVVLNDEGNLPLTAGGEEAAEPGGGRRADPCATTTATTSPTATISAHSVRPAFR